MVNVDRALVSICLHIGMHEERWSSEDVYLVNDLWSILQDQLHKLLEVKADHQRFRVALCSCSSLFKGFLLYNYFCTLG